MTTPESKLDQLLRQRAEIDDALRRHQTAFSVLFTDVVGSTSYFEKYGDIAGLAMLTRHEDIARKAISERGGRVIKNLGDSVMAEFPDALSAAKSAVEIQRSLVRVNAKLPENERIQLRIGINHGVGFRHEGDVYGDVVNVAARITKRTGPAQILVSTSVQDAVAKDGELRCNWLAKVEMKGKAEQGDVYEIVWTDTHTYMGLRQNVTMALKRGDLMAPGLDVNELVQTSPPTPSPATPAPVTAATPSTSQTVPVAAPLETRYEIMGELGSGGMGVVYKARDRETNDLVAIKMLRPEIAANEKGMLRFKNELRVARRITHKNVCRIHEFQRTADSAYITMEFVEGESLRHILTRFGSLGLAKGADVARQICSGLREAHTQGVVHRDLKPENVMLDAAGNVKVMDFGIAHAPKEAGGVQLTQTQAVIGTPSYMSPEQALGNPIDGRSDIYALGLILYEIFTGSPTFTADTAVAIAIKHIREAPVPPRELDVSIPEPINDAILKCLEKDPNKRYQTVDDLKLALDAAVPAEAGAIGARTGEVPQASTPPPIQPQAFYAPTPYSPGTPPSPLPPPATTVPTPAPAAKAPAVTQAEAPPARVPAPVAAPTKSSSATVVVILVAALVFLGGGGFAAYKILMKMRAGQPQTQATGDQAPAVQPPATNPPAGQNPPAGTAPPDTGAQPPATAPESAPGPSKQPGGSQPTGGTTPPANPAPPPAPAKISVSFALAKTLAGHTAAVVAVAFSADGRRVVTGSRDKTVRVWEAGTGQLVQTLKGHRDPISAVAMSPDGQQVASGSQDRTVILWDVGSGQGRPLPKETGFINSVAYSADGRLFAYSTSDGVVKVFDAGSGEGIAALEGHSGPVYSVAFSPDGRLLASAGRDQTVRVFNVSSGQQARALQGHADAVNTVLFSPDGRWLATASDDKTVKLWEVSSGRELRTFSGHSGAADGLAFGPDARWLAAGGEDKTVIVWDTLTGEELTTLSGHLSSITDLAVTRNGRWLASAAGDNTVRIYRRE